MPPPPNLEEVVVNPELLTLDRGQINSEMIVTRINGGQGIRRKLNNMGIHVNDTIVVKRSGIMRGPILVQIHSMEMALGRRMAKAIEVRPAE